MTMTVKNTISGSIAPWITIRWTASPAPICGKATTAKRLSSGWKRRTLCELNKFEPSIEGNMLKVDLESPNGTQSTIRIALRTGGAQ